MTRPIVAAIAAKIARADQHVMAFQDMRRAFLQSTPYGVSIKEDVGTGRRIYFVSKVDPLPHELLAIAGDIIQNLRSALDHIAYQLVLASRHGQPPDWPVYFPIAASADAYPGTKLGLVKGVKKDIADIFDAIEPYKGGRGHSLWQLNQLSKIDKHRLLVGATSFFAGVDVSGDAVQLFKGMKNVGDVKIPPMFLKEDNSSPLEVGYELYIEPLTKELVRDRQFAFDISFQAPGVVDTEPSVKTVMRLRKNSIEAVNRFFPHLQ